MSDMEWSGGLSGVYPFLPNLMIVLSQNELNNLKRG